MYIHVKPMVYMRCECESGVCVCVWRSVHGKSGVCVYVCKGRVVR